MTLFRQFVELIISFHLVQVRDEHGPNPDPDRSRILTFLPGSDRTGI